MSAIDPMTGHEYGWSFGKSAGGIRSSTRPYGWFSTPWRRSFFTTSRWPSTFSGLIASTRKPMRSDSRKRGISRAFAGAFSQ
jgi:hypothetical protein